MIARFARVDFGRREGVVEFGITMPANPTRQVISLFARSLGSGPKGWAALSSFYGLDIANPFRSAVLHIRMIAQKRPVGWWSGKDYRGKKPRLRGKSNWITRINHAVHPVVAASRWPPSRGRCPF